MDYGLIGEKLGHSYSKEIHEQLADYTYDLMPLDKEAFHRFMQERKFHAINVTIPYKKSVIPYLDEMDERAQMIGAVNTIVHKNGRLIGHNTDFDGFLYMLKHHQVEVSGEKVIVLGNGGAAQAVRAVLKAQGAYEIIIVKRNKSEDSITYEEMYQRHSDASIIINTSPVGMYPNAAASPMKLNAFPHLKAVLDVIYNPLYTPLLIEAKKQKIQAIGGLEMLVAQAVYAAAYFLDQDFDENLIDQIYHNIVKNKNNLILIGMPSAGKTTIGKAISMKLQRKFIDLDDIIVDRIGMSIADYFALKGEEAFRDMEEIVCEEISKESSLVISTGGGIIKRDINIDHLKRNGTIVYIERDIDKLLVDTSRPLSKDHAAIQKMYDERNPLYLRYSDDIIQNNTTLDACVEELYHVFQKRCMKL